ncbi:MAG: glycosyl transferase, partial [Bacteroidota bacterium]
QHSEWRYLLIGGLSAGMAVITKGPVALLLIGLSFFVYWVLQRFRMFFSIGHILAFGLSSLLASALLYGIETIKNGPWFITEFIKYNYRLYNIPDAGHGGFPGYHFVVLLVGCFPASLFCIRAMGPMPAANPVQSDFRRWMIILFWVVLIVFTIVKSKIVHYSSLCYFPLTFLAAVAIYEMVQGRMRFPKWIKIGTGVLGILIGIVPLILPYMAQHKEQYLRPLLSKDPFALKNLDAEVHWTGTEWLVGVFVIAYIITVLLLWKRQRLVQGFTLLLGGTAFTVMFILWGFIGRVELFSQGAAISFFESLAGKDVYVIPFGYRTYAHYFYPKLQPENKPKFYYAEDKDRGPDEWREFLLTQPQPKDVYVISKINKTDGLEKYPALKKIGEQNGFVFYKKEKG